MAEFTKKLHVGDDTISFYSTVNEASGYGDYGYAYVDGSQAYYALGTGASGATGSGNASSMRITKNGNSYYMLKKGFAKYTGNYKMSSLYPSTYQTMTSINMSTVGSNNPGLLTGLTNAYGMFQGCKAVTSISNLNKLDTSHVTDMGYMFNMGPEYYTDSALASLDLSNFDTSSVTNMHWMFYSARALTSLNISSFDTSNVTDMNEMFSHCPKVKTFTFPDNFGSAATDMSGMFNDCKALTSLDLSKFNTAKVKNFDSMFADGFPLTSLNISKFSFASATTLRRFFDGASKLSSITWPSSMSAPNLTNTAIMFRNCAALTTVPTINTSKVNNMEYMFYGCSKLPATFPWAIDCTSITSTSGLSNMFNSSSVTKVTLKNVSSSIKSSVNAALLKGSGTTLTIVFS